MMSTEEKVEKLRKELMYARIDYQNSSVLARSYHLHRVWELEDELSQLESSK